MKFNAITKESLHLRHDLNEKKSSVSFSMTFFFSFLKLIILIISFAPEQFLELPELHFLPPLKALRSCYGSERRKISVGAGANWGKSPTETFLPSAK